MRLPKPKQSPSRDEPKCECGRVKAKASEHHYHSGASVYHFWRCECGREWTTEQPSFDPRDPVTAEEVISVHELLQHFEEPLKELINEQE
jgi:hypothetical protein